MNRTTFVPPIGPWQEDTGTLLPCDRHRNWCAHRVNDPTRCSRCHARWVVIEARDARVDHEKWHDKNDARSEADKARLAAKAQMAKSGARRPRPATNGGTPVVGTHPGVQSPTMAHSEGERQ